MAESLHRGSVAAKIPPGETGQAAVEFTFIATTIIVLALALIDFGRLLNYMQVMVDLTRQGSNLASRGTDLPTSAAAVIAGDAPLNLSTSGEVIITSVATVSKVNTITGQASQVGISRTSHIGKGVGNPATVPAASSTILQDGQTMYITEVFYTFAPITPVGKMLNFVMPSTLYQVAYF